MLDVPSKADKSYADGKILKRIDEEIAPDEMTAKKHPRVADWWTKMQARPAFARAKFEPFITTL